MGAADVRRHPPPGLRRGHESSFSGNTNGNCVEMAALPDGDVAVRDSKHPERGHLVLTRAEIAAWLDGARAGEFEDLR